MRNPDDRGWLTPQEVGNLAGGFSAEFIRREIKAGELPAVQIVSRAGKMAYWRIRIEHARAYVLKLYARKKATPQTPQTETTPAA